jgi:hypothetical protein
MSTSPAIQVPVDSFDTLGVSVATSPRSSAVPRQGSVYDLITMAAASPIWFHPIADGRLLMINSQIWDAATPVGGSGAYSAYTVDTVPSWFLLDGPTGKRTAVPGGSVHIPMTTAATGVTVIAAASRPPNLLFLLSSGTINSATNAILQRFHVNPNTSVAIANEEVLPLLYIDSLGGVDTPAGLIAKQLAAHEASTTVPTIVSSIVFNAGMQYDSPNLVLYGTDSSNNVYKIRKPWGRVGHNTQTSVTFVKRTANDTIGSALGWQYYNGTGYSSDPTTLASMPITTHGPMSFGLYRNQVMMTTVSLSGTTYTGQFWISKSGQPFVQQATTVALGSSADGSYLGGGIQLMPQLSPNPTASVMLGALSGIPYVISKRTGSASDYVLDTVWNILPISS